MPNAQNSDDGVRVLPACEPGEIAAVAELFAEYASELGIDLGFQGFAAELANLPGAYAPPAGCLLLAVRSDVPIGCVGLRLLGPEICELKRLHVRETARRQGVGRRLAEVVIAEGRALGYRAIWLDTLASMTPAIRLYESLGFQRIPRYYQNPIVDAVYFGLTLRS